MMSDTTKQLMQLIHDMGVISERMDAKNRRIEQLEAKVEEERCILEMYKASAERRIKELQAKAEKYGKRYHQERHENIELRAKIKKAGDILAEHQTMTAPTYLFNAIAALKQEGEQWLA